jgi:Fe-S oxidoreductase
VDRAFLKKCYEIAWLQCTMCKRCSMYCPFGIDVATMIAIARSVCHSQGVTPKQLAFFSDHCDKTGNHMGIPMEELVDTCEWMAEEAEDDYRGVDIPVDQPGAKYMYTINPREPVYYPQDISNAAIIFAAAKESWTIPTFGWDCTNLPMFAGNRNLAGKQVKNVYEKALELKAQQIKATGAKIVITPCHNCFDQINDLSEEYELGVSARSFKEIIVESMIIPEHMKLE